MGRLQKLVIGDVVLENNVILAPMAGVSDLPFRFLCAAMGAGMTCMEMVSAKAIYYGNKNTESLLEIHPEESVVSLQLFGSDPYIISEMAKKIEERPFSILDINMGCPMPKIVNNGEGSALMKDPFLVEEIVRQTVKSIRKPVTVKIRKGFNDNMINAVEIAKAAESAGASAVTVHGRTREEYYEGQSDWNIIARVKDCVRIPVIGSGDVVRGQDAEKMLKETGCDGVMIGRAARGNPWIFKQVTAYLDGREIPDRPSIEEVRDTVLLHGRMQLEHKGEYTGIREMRKHIAWYSAGYPNSARLRRQVNEITSFHELEHVVNQFL